MADHAEVIDLDLSGEDILEHGLDEPEDGSVATMLSFIYGREYCEVEHDLLVFARHYQNDNR